LATGFPYCPPRGAIMFKHKVCTCGRIRFGQDCTCGGIWGHIMSQMSTHKSLLSPCIGHCHFRGGHLVWSRLLLWGGLVHKRLHFPKPPPGWTIRKTPVGVRKLHLCRALVSAVFSMHVQGRLHLLLAAIFPLSDHCSGP